MRDIYNPEKASEESKHRKKTRSKIIRWELVEKGLNIDNVGFGRASRSAIAG